MELLISLYFVILRYTKKGEEDLCRKQMHIIFTDFDFDLQLKIITSFQNSQFSSLDYKIWAETLTAKFLSYKPKSLPSQYLLVQSRQKKH